MPVHHCFSCPGESTTAHSAPGVSSEGMNRGNNHFLCLAGYTSAMLCSAVGCLCHKSTLLTNKNEVLTHKHIIPQGYLCKSTQEQRFFEFNPESVEAYWAL